MREKIKNKARALQRRSPLIKQAFAFIRKRKKMFLCAAAAAALVLFALVLLLLTFLGAAWVALLIVVTGIVLAVTAFAVNSLYKHWISWEKPTSYFSDLKHRNTAGLVLGSAKAWKYVRSDLFYDPEKELYNCTVYRRSLRMDFATLKTYHSHVKKGGKVFILVDYTDAGKMGDRVLPRDFKYVHPHYFLYTGEKENKKKSSWPILFYPGITIGFVWCKLLKYSGFYRNATWKVTADKNMDIDTGKVYRIAGILDQMLIFCCERGLQPVLLLLNGNRDDNIANEILKAYFTPKYYFMDIRIINSADELNRVIRETIAEKAAK
ncbi:MAG: hypothetical protein LUE29_06040 [Lachnospiraceae bacterium]|nr:hypothetical protein [Lachnospiraceae bacterium]